MKKLHQLLLIEAGEKAEPLATVQMQLLQAIAATPIQTIQLSEAIACGSFDSPPNLIVLHTNLETENDVQRYTALQKTCPFGPILIVCDDIKDATALRAIEAGALDAITTVELTPAFLNKLVLLCNRHHKQSDVHRNREQLLACVQNMPNVAVQWYDGEGKVLFWNAASESIFGFSAVETLGQNIDELFVVPGSKHFWLNKLKHLAATNSTYGPQEWPFRHRDGSQRWCISTLVPIPSYGNERWYACMDVDITSSKKAEVELQEKKESYYALFNQASDAVFINDDEGRFLEMNERAAELSGYSRAQLLRMRVKELYSADELNSRPIMWKQLLRGERTLLERNMLRADGTLLPIEVTAQRMADGRTIAIIRDTSERRANEEALRRSEEKYRSLVEQQADAITIFNDEGRVLEANQSATNLLQYTEEEFKKMYFPDILLPEEVKKNPIDFATLKAGTPTIKQRRMRRKDGVVVETEVHSKKLWDGLFLASVRDLTERLQVQHQLEREINLSNSVINSLPGIFFLFTKEGKHLRWNKQKEVITGWTAAETAVRHPLDCIAEQYRVITAAKIEEAFIKGHADFEGALLIKSGKELPYYFSIVSLIYAGQQCIMGTGIDLSERRNLEKQLSDEKLAQQKKIMQAMLEAEEKERNKLGLELHDNVNQILSVVQLYLSILSSGEKVNDITLPKTIELLNTATREIRNLSHNLAIAYRFEAGLSEALTEMVEQVKATKDFSIQLQLSRDIDRQTTSSQKLALYRIIQEQLNNIIKYAKATDVEIKLQAVNAEITLSIIDNGVGFNPRKRKRGLGLNNITNRAEALDGEVDIQSAPGEGCKLEVRLPISEMEKAN